MYLGGVSAYPHMAAMGTWNQRRLQTSATVGTELSTKTPEQPPKCVLKALELERVFGHDLLDGTVRVNVHLDVFGQLMRFKADKRVQQTHEVAQCRVIARNVEAAPPLYLSENDKKKFRIRRFGALLDCFRGRGAKPTPSGSALSEMTRRMPMLARSSSLAGMSPDLLFASAKKSLKLSLRPSTIP